MITNQIKWGILLSWLLIIFSPGFGRSADISEDPAAGMEFVFIKGDCFQMGSENGAVNERPVHKACIGNFFMGKYEVTQGEWKAVMGSNPSFFNNCGDNCPVESVSWIEIQEFIRRLNKKIGTEKYRLPTEAEWEYAARAGSATKYFFGDDPADLDQHAWYKGNSRRTEPLKTFYKNEIINTSPHPVGQKKPNGFGLYDIYGNVWEWVSDWYGEYHPGQEENPKGPLSGSIRVYRGGSWHGGADLCRSAKRFGSHPLSAEGDRGFRLVKTLK